MEKNNRGFIFIDESGDPGKPFKINNEGKKVPTGASMFYILTAICLNSKQMFKLEDEILKIKQKYKYKSELKSTHIPLKMYKDILKLINKLEIKVYYRLVNKKTYKGKFASMGDRRLHNVFDEYNLQKLVTYSVKMVKYMYSEVVIDRADRRMLNGTYDNCDNYLKSKANTKTLERVRHVVHVNSEYVNAMQLSDLVCGAIRDHFTKKNPDLRKVIDKKNLKKIY
jgi:hypothetical protein